jgi:hypothetical protein
MADFETHTLRQIQGGIQPLIALLRDRKRLLNLRSLSAKFFSMHFKFFQYSNRDNTAATEIKPWRLLKMV